MGNNPAMIQLLYVRLKGGRQSGWRVGLATWIGLLFSLALAGCTAKHYRQSADKEAYRLISEKSPLVPNMETNFTIETNLVISLNDLPILQPGIFLLSEGDLLDFNGFIQELMNSANAVSQFLWSQLSPDHQAILKETSAARPQKQAILIAELNRLLQGASIYQTNRFAGVPLSPRTIELLVQPPTAADLVKLNRLLLEAAYPLAISRSFQVPDESMGEDGKAEIGCRIVSLEKALEIAVKNSRNYQTFKETLYMEALSLALARHKFTPIFHGNVKSTVHDGVDRLTDTPKVSGSGNVGSEILLRSGARIVTDFTSDFTRFILGNPSMSTGSRLAGTLTQPLLRGGGYKATMENLTQAERNLLYALRDFVQFRRDYIVTVATDYYGVLRNRDTVRNTWQSYQSFKKSADRVRAFIDVEQGAIADLGRLEQNRLLNEANLISAIRSYKQNLDRFKISLGLPTDVRIVLDDRELQKLTIVTNAISAEDAVRVALVSRLDFHTTRDQFEDAGRKVALAVKGLLPDLDLVLEASVPRRAGSGLPEVDFNQANWGGSLNLNLPLDRKAERNTYRSALITCERARRSLELAVDNIKFDIYNSWRQLDEAKRTYDSSVIGVKLAQERVAEQDLREELGSGDSEKKSSAQDSLTASLNQRTSALVAYTLALLALWRAMGILNIKDNGQWEEVNDLKKP